MNLARETKKEEGEEAGAVRAAELIAEGKTFSRSQKTRLVAYINMGR